MGAKKCSPQGLKRETGDNWDEPLPIFTEGSININFYNNIIGYTAGDCVSGTIDIEIKN